MNQALHTRSLLCNGQYAIQEGFAGIRVGIGGPSEAV